MSYCDEEDSDGAYEVVHTDGSCLDQANKATRRAGYSVYFGKNDPRNVSEPITGEKHTNNVGELTAVCVALERASANKKTLVVSDSKYVIDGLVGSKNATPWHHRWLENDWKNAKGKPVENRQLWERLIAISKRRKFRMRWQKAHVGHHGNSKADEMAKNGAMRAKRTK